MTQADRLAALEQELIATREAAARLLASTMAGIVKSPEGRAELRRGFDEAIARQPNSIEARILRLAAEMIGP